jgi:hypothetical protein
MSQPDVPPKSVPPVKRCGSYGYGHDVHYIQARLSREAGPGRAVTFSSVSDGGIITFTDGSSLWNHDPARLRALASRHGREMMLGPRGVLRIPHDDGSWYCISVATEPDPCRPETADVIPGESVLDEVMRRGGVVRSVRSVLAELSDFD